MKNFVVLLIILLNIIILFSCDNDNITNKNEDILFTNSEITELIPKNNSTEIKSEQVYQIIFSENVKPGTGSIHIYRQWHDEFVQSLDVKAELTYTGNKASFKFSEKLIYNQNYYILIDKGAFIFNDNRKYEGLDDKTFWTFNSESLKNKKSYIFANMTMGNILFDFVPFDYIVDLFIKDSDFQLVGTMNNPSTEDIFRLSIIFPTNTIVNKEFDFTKREPFQIFSHINLKKMIGDGYIVESGIISLDVYTADYSEGEFNFVAKTANGKKLEANNGYFFVVN